MVVKVEEKVVEIAQSEKVRIRLHKLNRLGYGKTDDVDSATGRKKGRIWESNKHYMVSRDRWDDDLRYAKDSQTGERYFEAVSDDQVIEVAPPPPPKKTFRPIEVDVVDVETGKELGRESVTHELDE